MRWPFLPRRAGADDRAPSAVERVDPQAAYALWAKNYPPRPHNRLMEIEHQAVLSLLPDVHGRTVLDAGCGTGRYLQELKARGAFVIGMDLSEAMLERARSVSGRVARADVRALPFDDQSIDVVVCGLALGDVDELEIALAELARVMRPDACLIYSVVHPSGEAQGWTRTFSDGGRHMAIDGFWHSADRHRRACLSAGLAIEEWREPEIAELPGTRPALVIRARNTGRRDAH